MEKNNQFKVAILWMLMAVGIVMHSVFALDGIFFGAKLQLPDTDGSEPAFFTVAHIVFEILPLLMAMLAVFITAKGFVWFSCLWASLLCLFNTYHLIATCGEEPFSIAQIVLLAFVLTVNIMLTITLWKSLKGKVHADECCTK